MDCDNSLGHKSSEKFCINLATKRADLSVVIMVFGENVNCLDKCSWYETTAIKKGTVGSGPSQIPHVVFRSSDKRPGMTVYPDHHRLGVLRLSQPWLHSSPLLWGATPCLV